MKKWEYSLKITGLALEDLEEFQDVLNAGGEEGWEVVSLSVIPQSFGMEGVSSFQAVPKTQPLGFACLKREKR